MFVSEFAKSSTAFSPDLVAHCPPLPFSLHQTTNCSFSIAVFLRPWWFIDAGALTKSELLHVVKQMWLPPPATSTCSFQIGVWHGIGIVPVLACICTVNSLLKFVHAH